MCLPNIFYFFSWRMRFLWILHTFPKDYRVTNRILKTKKGSSQLPLEDIKSYYLHNDSQIIFCVLWIHANLQHITGSGTISLAF